VKLPVPELPVLVQRLEQSIPAPGLRHRVVVRGTIHAKNIGTARFLPKTVAAPVVEVSAVLAQPAAIPSTVAPIEDQWTGVLGSTPQEFATLLPAPPPAAAPSGLIGGALRKTKDSIVKTGAVSSAAIVVAGSTLADTFKGVVGAFKKVSPF
jgi:hypothetical protein